MTSFWAISLFWIAILVFIAIALAFILPPLLRPGAGGLRVEAASANIAIQRAQEMELEADLRNGTLAPDQYGDAKRDINEGIGQEIPAASTAGGDEPPGRWAGFALAVIVPVGAIAGYLLLGSPDHLASTPAASAAPDGQHDPAAMVAALEERLNRQPNDGAGWAMLGRSYVALGRNQQGAQALGRAAELVSGDARLLADYAEAVALTQNRNMAGVPIALVERALAFDGKDGKALMLAGVAASQRQDFVQAAAYWRRLLEVIPRDSDLARQIAAAIDKADEAAGKTDVRSAIARMIQQAPSGKSLSGMLEISGRLAPQVSPSDTVFIFAQAPGVPTPLAIQRITAGQLPYRFTLDDSVSMSAEDRLTDHEEVILTARVSKSGQAMPRSGDLQGRVGPVKIGQVDISLSIDSVVP